MHKINTIYTLPCSRVNLGKTKFWDTWIKYKHQELLTKVFQELNNQPNQVTDSHMDIIEDIVKVVYYPNKKNLGN